MNLHLLYFVSWLFFASTCYGGIVRVAGREEEAYAMKMWHDMCLEGRRDFALDGNNNPVYCAMDKDTISNPETVQVVYPPIKLGKSGSQPENQIIVIDPPSHKYNHKVTIQGDSFATPPKTTIYVRPPADKHELEVLQVHRGDSLNTPSTRPTVLFLNSEGKLPQTSGGSASISSSSVLIDALQGQGSERVEQSNGDESENRQDEGKVRRIESGSVSSTESKDENQGIGSNEAIKGSVKVETIGVNQGVVDDQATGLKSTSIGIISGSTFEGTLGQNKAPAANSNLDSTSVVTEDINLGSTSSVATASSSRGEKNEQSSDTVGTIIGSSSNIVSIPSQSGIATNIEIADPVYGVSFHTLQDNDKSNQIGSNSNPSPMYSSTSSDDGNYMNYRYGEISSSSRITASPLFPDDISSLSSTTTDPDDKTPATTTQINFGQQFTSEVDQPSLVESLISLTNTQQKTTIPTASVAESSDTLYSNSNSGLSDGGSDYGTKPQASPLQSSLSISQNSPTAISYSVDVENSAVVELTTSSDPINVIPRRRTNINNKGSRRQGRRKKQRNGEQGIQQNIDPNGNATSSVYFQMDNTEMMHFSVRHPY